MSKLIYKKRHEDKNILSSWITLPENKLYSEISGTLADFKQESDKICKFRDARDTASEITVALSSSQITKE